MTSMLYVGAQKEAVKEARAMIIDILKSVNSEQVKIEALKTARDICQVNGLTVSNCTFTNKAK